MFFFFFLSKVVRVWWRLVNFLRGENLSEGCRGKAGMYCEKICRAFLTDFVRFSEEICEESAADPTEIIIPFQP